MSTQVNDRRRRAAEAMTALGAGLSGHEVLSVQCAHSHHVAVVYDTEAGLVFRSLTGPHAHGRKDRADVAHHASQHGDAYVEVLTDREADEMLPASCDCGSWSLARADLVADVRAGKRTTHVA
jgi:hypothetical protein